MDRRFEGWSGRGARGCAFLLACAGIALSLSSAAGTRAKQPRQEPGESAAQRAALNAYRGLPLSFVRNAGQLDRRVRYSTQIGSMSVFLTRREAVVALAEGRRSLALRLAFLGASPKATISGRGRSPGRVNYLVENDPARWQTNLPTYRGVVYHNLWPGIDMAVLGRGGQLKYEFRVAPRADPAQIRLRYRGQERLALEGSGALRIKTRLAVLHDTRPVSYQLVDGKRVAVGSSFALGQAGAYGFALGAYDRHYPLVIDPGLVYSTYLGGMGDVAEGAGGIAVDRAGMAYISGSTDSLNFPTTAGASDRSFSGGDFDVFVTKLNRTGSALVYSTYLGGARDEFNSGIAVDEVGSAYVVGSTDSVNFPTTPGAFDVSYNSATAGCSGSCRYDAVVTKLSPDGSGLSYSTYLGGEFADGASGIAVDRAGSAYVSGLTVSSNFPTTADAFDRDRGGQDGFVTKLNPAGSALAYSTYLGGASFENSIGIAVDRAGSAYVTGWTDSTDFPTTAGAFDRSHGGRFRADAFVTKLGPAGSALSYSTFLGGSGTDGGVGIEVDGADRAYVTGSTGSRNFPTSAGAFDRSFNGGFYGDTFVAKLNRAGSALAYSTYLGGSGKDDGVGIAVDGAGRAYVTGSTGSRNFPTSTGAFDRSFRGNLGDAFITKLNRSGSDLAYSTYLGGGRITGGIAVDGAGSAYVAGDTDSGKFPTTAHAFDRNLGGESDAFVTKLDLIRGPVRCHVPRLVGLKVAEAKRMIRALDCSVGRIRRVRSKRVGRVVVQSPPAGAVRRRGFKVNLTVGRR
jgi:Beta-propeller repeat/PASTA domain